MNQRVIVVGGGASGLMAAGRAGSSGAQVTLIEKGSRVGRKLLLTGNGRCNLTNVASPRDFYTHLGPNGAFMRNSLARCDAQTMRAFFATLGVATYSDDQGRVYPVTNKSNDVLMALHNYCSVNRVQSMLNTRVIDLVLENKRIAGIQSGHDQTLSADAVIMATGGTSWSKTGSEGDGYRLLKRVGHTVGPLFPGLVPLVTSEPSLQILEGLSFNQVGITARRGTSRMSQITGDILFTRDGLSGPAILNLSNTISPLLAEGAIELLIDFIPHISTNDLELRLGESDPASEADVSAFLHTYIPRRMALYLIDLLQKQASPAVLPGRLTQLSPKQRSLLVELLKRFSVRMTGTRPFTEAMVTVGGVCCNEVNPVTFESILVPGLYIVGELLDIAGESGGYNLQCAFTSGWLAGFHAAGTRQ